MPRKNKIYVGLTVKMFTVIEDLGTLKDKGYRRMARCKCECGNEYIISVSNLFHGNTKSCGCLKKRGTRLDHGRSHTTEHRVWSKMIDRCRNKNTPEYKNYGGRGIKVCDRWLDFKNFLSDMGMRPSNEVSIDRIDNNGDYEPGNCRWATRAQQSVNKRTNVFFEYGGMRMTKSQWCDFLEFRRHMVENHLRRGKTFAETIKYLKENHGLDKI